MVDSNKREWNNCFIENNQEILLDLAVFALQEQPKDNFKWSLFLKHGIMAHILWPLCPSNPRILLHNDPVFNNSCHLNYLSIVPRHSICTP